MKLLVVAMNLHRMMIKTKYEKKKAMQRCGTQFCFFVFSSERNFFSSSTSSSDVFCVSRYPCSREKRSIPFFPSLFPFVIDQSNRRLSNDSASASFLLHFNEQNHRMKSNEQKTGRTSLISTFPDGDSPAQGNCVQIDDVFFQRV